MNPYLIIVCAMVAVGCAWLLFVAFQVLCLPQGSLRLLFWGRNARSVMPVPTLLRWIKMPKDLYYHRGHAWVRDEGSALRIGIDDFAQKLLGTPESIELPPRGARLIQGAEGWKLRIGSKTIGMLSPIRGKVTDVNERVLENPSLISLDPYGEGWLLLVEPEHVRANLRNLFSGEMARVWIEETVERLCIKIKDRPVVLIPDGGVAVSGIAKAIEGEDWDRLAKEFLLVDG